MTAIPSVMHGAGVVAKSMYDRSHAALESAVTAIQTIRSDAHATGNLDNVDSVLSRELDQHYHTIEIVKNDLKLPSVSG